MPGWHHFPELGRPPWCFLEAAPDCLMWAGVPWPVVILFWEGETHLICSVFSPFCHCPWAGGMSGLSAQAGVGEGSSRSLHAQGLSPSPEESYFSLHLSIAWRQLKCLKNLSTNTAACWAIGIHVALHIWLLE